VIHPRVLRRFGISALLGLPAALVAHTLVFGQTHAVAGSFHGLAVGVGAGFALLAALLAGIAAARHTRADAPHVVITALTAIGWLAALEATESPHGIPVLLCLLALALATAIVATATRACAQTIAAIVSFFGVRTTARAALFAGHARFVVCRRHTIGEIAIFSRPPPALS
jgi:hypothetical protein